MKSPGIESERKKKPSFLSLGTTQETPCGWAALIAESRPPDRERASLLKQSGESMELLWASRTQVMFKILHKVHPSQEPSPFLQKPYWPQADPQLTFQRRQRGKKRLFRRTITLVFPHRVEANEETKREQLLKPIFLPSDINQKQFLCSNSYLVWNCCSDFLLILISWKGRGKFHFARVKDDACLLRYMAIQSRLIPAEFWIPSQAKPVLL